MVARIALFIIASVLLTAVLLYQCSSKWEGPEDGGRYPNLAHENSFNNCNVVSR
jgi:hypothetical protein